MTAPCTRCGHDCSGNCLKLAEGTQPGTSKLVGQRVSVTYSFYHQRSKVTETRHAIGRVTSILPDGALWVVTDREGGIRIEATNVEVAE